MIYTGENEYPIYLGDSEIPAIYCGEELIYPVNLGTLTGITLENLTWVNDVPYSGGTADAENCTFKVVAHYDSGKSRSVTSKATITGSLSASATTSTERTDLGLLTLTATYEGFTASDSVEAYQEVNHYNQYLTFRITSPGKIVWYASNAAFSGLVINYSLDNGTTWTSIASSNNVNNGFDVAAGDVVIFKGENDYYARPTTSTLLSSSYYTQFTNTTAEYIAEGNMMSLIYGDNFAGNDNLPTNTTHNFAAMFNGCTGMSNADNLILPAMTLNTCCYRNLFSGCKLHTSPKLPATTLAKGCYVNMFINCYTLEEAPDLPAPTLVESCYEGMLYMQSAAYNLRYIKCLARNKSASRCLTNFHNSTYVSPTGVFVKYPGVSWVSGGTDGIPNGWTIIEATE